MQTTEESRLNYNRECEVYDKERYETGTRYVRADEETTKFLLMKLNYRTVLELGAGTGRYGILLQENGFRWSGIEISEGMIAKAMEKDRQLNIMQGDVENKQLYLHENYDNVICVRAFNFFTRPMKVIANVWHTLKHNGQFILIYYNLNIFRKISIPILHDDKAVQQLYTYKQIEKLLEHAGFVVQQHKHMINLPCYMYNHFPKLVDFDCVKKFDNTLKSGWIVAVVAQKR